MSATSELRTRQLTAVPRQPARHRRLGEERRRRGRDGLWQAVEDNHRCNCLLWDEEDLARRRNVADAEIAENKRAIDGTNQKRNDAIERIDEQLLNTFLNKKENARLSSRRRVGAMTDRLSILSPKIHYIMRLQTLRTGTSSRGHIDNCLG